MCKCPQLADSRLDAIDPQRKFVAHEADVREAMRSILGLLPA